MSQLAASVIELQTIKKPENTGTKTNNHLPSVVSAQIATSLDSRGDSKNGDRSKADFKAEPVEKQQDLGGLLLGEIECNLSENIFHLLDITSFLHFKNTSKTVSERLSAVEEKIINEILSCQIKLVYQTWKYPRCYLKVFTPVCDFYDPQDGQLFGNSNERILEAKNERHRQIVQGKTIKSDSGRPIGHTLYVSTKGNVSGDGNNEYDQLGTISGVPTRIERVKVAMPTKVKKVAAGMAHTVAIDEKNDLYTWGRNDSGQLGHGNFDKYKLPTKVVSISNVIDVAAGYCHTACVDQKGDVYTWGYNDQGQLGHGNTDTFNLPTRVSPLKNIRKIEAGTYHTVCLDAFGRVFTWGLNTEGQLGHGDYDNYNQPQEVSNSNLTDVVDIAVGHYHTFCIRRDGKVLAWGKNDDGQLGVGDEVNHPIPTFVDIPGQVVHISASTCLRGETLTFFVTKIEDSVKIYSSGDLGGSSVCVPIFRYETPNLYKKVLDFQRDNARVAKNILEAANKFFTESNKSSDHRKLFGDDLSAAIAKKDPFKIFEQFEKARQREDFVNARKKFKDGVNSFLTTQSGDHYSLVQRSSFGYRL